ncbi:hypothetical protein CSOJ01_00861 [Colletotrichum sojae]|uniref:Uncharacterized protein n=1 Tax=Colletotrichum sojae TaxID=2175907 RepID=A0A8H6N5A0_9PEZI|nr:hypothetical protein CSOJ01_00861 [Colletotrichum sojae]
MVDDFVTCALTQSLILSLSPHASGDATAVDIRPGERSAALAIVFSPPQYSVRRKTRWLAHQSSGFAVAQMLGALMRRLWGVISSACYRKRIRVPPAAALDDPPRAPPVSPMKGSEPNVLYRALTAKHQTGGNLASQSTYQPLPWQVLTAVQQLLSRRSTLLLSHRDSLDRTASHAREDKAMRPKCRGVSTQPWTRTFALAELPHVPLRSNSTPHTANAFDLVGEAPTQDTVNWTQDAGRSVKREGEEREGEDENEDEQDEGEVVPQLQLRLRLQPKWKSTRARDRVLYLMNR